MKIKFLPVLSLTLFFIHSITIAKTTEIDTTWALSFYPLQTGNYWEYSEKVAEGDYVYNEDKFSVEIVGDTLMNNGKSYKILQKQYVDSLSCEYIFERVDSLSGNVYRFNTIDYDNIHTEYLIDSLYAQVGDTVFSKRYYRGKDDVGDVLFREQYWYAYLDESQLWKLFSDITRLPGYWYELGENIGLRSLTIGSETRPLYIQVQYAKIDGKEYGSQTNVDKTNAAKVPSFQILHNYPNPFNNSTMIRYQLAKNAHVRLTIFTQRGEQVRNLVNEYQAAGQHQIRWHGDNQNNQPLSSGVYFCRINFGNRETETLKLLLLK